MASANVKGHIGGLTINPPPAPRTSEAADTLFSPGVRTPGHTISSAFKEDPCKDQQPKCKFFPWQRKDKKPE